MSLGTGDSRAARLGTAAVVVLALAACGDGERGVDACKDAMRAQLEEGMTNPDAEEGTRPAACEGVSEADLERIVGELLEEELREGFEGSSGE